MRSRIIHDLHAQADSKKEGDAEKGHRREESLAGHEQLQRGILNGHEQDRRTAADTRQSRDSGQTARGTEDQHNDPHGIAGEEPKPFIPHNPWQQGYDRREKLRRREVPPGGSRRQARDPHGHVPHAQASTSVAHSGRGGFPNPFQSTAGVLRHVSPASYRYLSALLSRTEADAAYSPHPLRDLAEELKRPFKDHHDKEEAKEAASARWLPPGIRAVVVGRNSQFFEEELEDDELELLGALEYRSMNLMAVILIAVSSPVIGPRRQRRLYL